MAKFQISFFLKNKQGQSVVEYILLLAVISALGFSVLNHQAFKDFTSGNSGLFLKLRQGIEYSYRYGLPVGEDTNLDEARNFSLQTNQHDLYFDKKGNQSRFFTGIDPYGN